MAPGAVRLIWFILGLFGGFGLLLYIAGWLLIPEEGAEQSIAEDVTDRLGDTTAWLGVGLIVIAAVILVSMLGWVRSDLAWAVALLSVGILMYQGHLGTAFGPRPDQGADAAGADSLGDTDAADIDAEVLVPESAGDFGDEPPREPTRIEATGPAEEQIPRHRRERSFLGRLTIGTVFIGLGIMAMLDTSDVVRPSFSHYMTLAVGIVGVGLLVGSVYGRSRGLIFAGVVLVPIMLASSVVTATFDGGWGDPVFRPRSLSEIDSHYTLTGGEMEIDLRRIQLDGKVVEIEGDLGFGRLLVLVPADAGLDVTAHVGFGDVIVFGDHNGGVDVDRTVRVDGDGVIELDLDVGFGALELVEVNR
jgi:hypothetical protein